MTLSFDPFEQHYWRYFIKSSYKVIQYNLDFLVGFSMILRFSYLNISIYLYVPLI